MMYTWCDNTLSVADGFSNTFKTPCVVFTGHPSLRFGDVVHFVEMWGSSSANTIIFTGALYMQSSRNFKNESSCLFENQRSYMHLHYFWPVPF